MRTYEVELVGLLKVTAHVTADSAQRAAEIAWNAEMAPGESVEYQQHMECFDTDGPTVASVWDLSAREYDEQLSRYISRGGGGEVVEE